MALGDRRENSFVDGAACSELMGHPVNGRHWPLFITEGLLFINAGSYIH